MQKIKTLIIDDEPLARKRIANLLQHHPEVEVTGECKNGLEAVTAIKKQKPHLIFLDVQMPDLDGFGVLKKLDVSQLPFIIFVTAYDQYALQAFEFHALDYLLKPFDDDRFEAALTQAITQIRRKTLADFSSRMAALMADFEHGNQQAQIVAGQNQPNNQYRERLAVKSAGRVFFLKTEDIDWIQAAGVYVKLHVGREAHLIRESISKLETQLSPQRFLRIHRSTIVNIDQIKELHPYFHGEYIVIMKDGTELKLSRNYREKFQAVVGNL